MTSRTYSGQDMSHEENPEAVYGTKPPGDLRVETAFPLRSAPQSPARRKSSAFPGSEAPPTPTSPLVQMTTPEDEQRRELETDASNINETRKMASGWQPRRAEQIATQSDDELAGQAFNLRERDNQLTASDVTKADSISQGKA